MTKLTSIQGQISTKKSELEQLPEEEFNEDGICKNSVLTLTIVEGLNLVTTDLTGMGDPYVVVEYLGQKWKTDWIQNTACPVWNKTFEIPISKPEDLTITAMDYNGWRGDTVTGNAFLPITFFENQMAKDF